MFSSRSFLLTAACLALAGALPAATEPRNVVMIMIDDLNDWVRFLDGHPQVQTPNLDRLAARGVAFTNAHTAAPLCGPSRAALMTGLAPTRTGIYDNQTWFRRVPSLRSLVTLPQALQQAGFHTIGAGKIYHTHAGGGQPPSEFTETPKRTWMNYGPLPEKQLNYTDPRYRIRDWGAFPVKDEDQADHAIASYAVQRLQQPFAGRFFLSVGFFRPHVPFFASQKWHDLYPRERIEVPADGREDLDDVPAIAHRHYAAFDPEWVREHGKAADIVQAYLACVSYVDSEVGRVLDAIDASPHRDNTLIAVVSDHGFHLGEKNHYGKTTLWERSTRVPLILAGPGLPAGVRCERPVSLLDLYPTILELTGAPARPGLSGRSLVPLLRDPQAARGAPAVITFMPGNHAVRSDHWRYIRYQDGSEELYDHRRDSGERTNLAGDPAHATVLAEHRRWLPAEEVPVAVGSPAPAAK